MTKRGTVHRNLPLQNQEPSTEKLNKQLIQNMENLGNMNSGINENDSDWRQYHERSMAKLDNATSDDLLELKQNLNQVINQLFEKKKQAEELR